MLGGQLGLGWVRGKECPALCCSLAAISWHFPGDVLPASMGQAEGSEGSYRLWRLRKEKKKCSLLAIDFGKAFSKPSSLYLPCD